MANPSEQTSDVVSLGEYGRFLRRRWPSLLVGLLIGLLSGFAWYTNVSPNYEARATVTIYPITNELFSTSPVNQLVNTATEAEIMRSIEIAERAAVGSGIDGDPRDLRNQLTISVPPSSLALEVTFTADSPEKAAAGANAFATSYLEFRAETAEARRAGYAERLRTQLNELSAQLAELEDGTPQGQALAQEITVVRQQLGDAISVPITPGHVVSRALPPRYQSSPRLLAVFGGGGVVGLLLGIGLSIVRQRTDDRILAADEVRAVSGLPVIGTLPSLDRHRPLRSREIDDIALTAMRLTSPTFGHDLRSWVVVRADLGRPTCAETIAWWLGQRHDVALVRLDPDAAAQRAAAAEHWDLLAFFPSPGLRTYTGPVDRSNGYVVLDGSGLHTLAEVIHIQGVDVVLVAVELGVTRRRHLERTVNEIRGLSPDYLAPGVVVIRRRPWIARSWRGRIRNALWSAGRRRHRPAAPAETTVPDPEASRPVEPSLRQVESR